MSTWNRDGCGLWWSCPKPNQGPERGLFENEHAGWGQRLVLTRIPEPAAAERQDVRPHGQGKQSMRNPTPSHHVNGDSGILRTSRHRGTRRRAMVCRRPQSPCGRTFELDTYGLHTVAGARHHPPLPAAKCLGSRGRRRIFRRCSTDFEDGVDSPSKNVQSSIQILSDDERHRPCEALDVYQP